jgi:GTPase Era involved in 16S rRNA processing
LKEGKTMQEIQLTHNPFTVETTILVNGQQPAESSPLMDYKDKRLQQWVETLFKNLRRDFNDERAFRLSFTGMEADWLDICEAAEKARIEDMEIELVKPEHFARSGEERLKKIIALKDEAKPHLNLEDNDFTQTFNKAQDRDFDVFVVATMSSGKSTLVNAILGQDLLPAANEATTATIVEIYDNDSFPAGKFDACGFNQDRQELERIEGVKRETLETWNKDEQVFKIKLEGDIQGIDEREHVRLVLTDTPGPNSSQNEEHRQKTMACIQDDTRNPLVLYVLNGTQLGTDDDKRLLELVSDYMKKGGKQSKDRFIFVVNKMDCFDPEKEKVSGVLERVREYLESNGIPHPQVYPVTARLAYLLRKEKAALDRVDAERLTRTEQKDCNALKFAFDVDASETADMDMEQYMPLTQRVKAKLGDRKLPPLLRRSGIPALESMIDEYIDKYSFPYRVKYACDALREAISKGKIKANLEKQLDTDFKSREKIIADIKNLKAKRGKGFDAKAYKERILREGKHLPKSVAQELSRLQDELEPFLRKMDKKLQGKLYSYRAHEMLEEAGKELEFKYAKLINEYKKLFESAQEKIRDDLKKEYRKYIKSLFPESADLKLNILEGIKDNLCNFSLDLGEPYWYYKEEIVEQSGTLGSFKRAIGKLFAADWGTNKVLRVYVNLSKHWAEERINVEAAFLDLIKKSRETIEFGHGQLLQEYADFMGKTFDHKFKELLDSLEVKISDKNKCQDAIDKAKASLQWIENFEKELDATLEVRQGETA